MGTDEQGNLYIWDDEDGLIKVKDDRGNDFFLDESDEYGGNWSRESVQATWDDTAEKYLIAAKETFVEIWDGQETVQQSWLIFEVDGDGKTSWESMKWNVNIADYEERFNFDLNEDGDLGINLDKLVVIETDETGAKPARLGDAIYVIDGNDQKQITDSYGYAPDFEYEDNWEGGSMSAEVYAVEKTTEQDGYALLIKHAEEHDDDFYGYDDEEGTDVGDDDTEDILNQSPMLATNPAKIPLQRQHLRMASLLVISLQQRRPQMHLQGTSPLHSNQIMAGRCNQQPPQQRSNILLEPAAMTLLAQLILARMRLRHV